MNEEWKLTPGTTPSTVTWCGTVKYSLTDYEKSILFHEHEAKRTRFFGMMRDHEHHVWMLNILREQGK